MELYCNRKASAKRKKPAGLIKRRLALAMASLMIVTSPMPGLSMVTYAAGTELMEESLTVGASESTAWAWKVGGFDFAGLEAGQNSYLNSSLNPQGIKTTYGWGGYQTYLNKTNSASVPPEAAGSNNGTTTHRYAGTTNGSVESIDGMGVELKITIKPSEDNKYAYVDYYVYETKGVAGNWYYLGTGADTQIDDDDYAACYQNTRGFHMVNTRNKKVFDCVTYDEDLGIKYKPDFRYVGLYNQRNANMFSKTDVDTAEAVGVDSGIAYAWKFQLKPYETVHRRVAFAIRSTSYYVSNSGTDSTAAEGTYSSPFKTIDYVLNKFQGKKGYIYLMDDMDITGPITIDGGTGTTKTDVTIASTDFNRGGVPQTNESNYLKTLKRSTGASSLFKVTNGGTLKFTDIKLSGGNLESSEPLLQVSDAKLEINSGTVIRDCNGTSAVKGSAVDVTGAGNLSINLGEITANRSSGKGAVNFNSTGTFQVKNKVMIRGNTDSGGKNANVYLPAGKQITVGGDLGVSEIGVSAEAVPVVSPGGNSTRQEQEVLVAVPGGGYTVAGISPFSENFIADQADTGVYISIGSKGLNNEKDTVLKKDGFTITFSRMAEDGTGVGGAPIEAMLQSPGDTISIPAAKAGTAQAGYKLVKAETDFAGFQVHTGAADDGGHEKFSLTGTMPGQAVAVTYIYERAPSSIVFHANGGSPEPEPLTGNPGERINSSIPSINRYGYKLKTPGKTWSRVNDRQNPMYIEPSSDWKQFPEASLELYAIMVPDESVTFQLTAKYLSQSGHEFQSETLTPKSVEAPLTIAAKAIPGYLYSRADSKTTPNKYNYGTIVSVTPVNGSGIPTVTPDTPISIGSFQDSFTGAMPGQDATVSFIYRVDPSVTNPLRVRYRTESGNNVAEDSAVSYSAETPIAVVPAEKYGYECLGVTIDSGNAEHSAGGLVSVVDDFAGGSLTLNSRMPNQPVQITYTYKVTAEGYPLTAKYIDNGAADPKLKNIKSPVVENHPADSPVNMIYETPYGYRLADKAMEPSPVKTHLLFDGSNHIAGTMHDDEVTATYGHSRDSGKWAEITYISEPAANGSLTGDGISADLQSLGGGSYKAQVLINDGSEAGREKAWTLEQIEQKGLMPGKAANNYYLFDGWFIDTGDPGYNGEELLTKDYQFTGTQPVTLTAHFKENPDQWLDVRFAAGDHGSLNPDQQLTLHTTVDRTWEGIAAASGLPLCTPEINYLQETEEDGRSYRWYDSQNRLMTAASSLKNGETYITKFYKDPGVFGTNTAAPKAQAGLLSSGEGRVTVFDAAYGYRYVLAGQNGKVIRTEDGMELSSRVYFDYLQPGTRYIVYEAPGTASATIGSDVSGIPGISGPTEVLTPVVQNNYQVIYDENDQGKTILTIRPASRDTDYALLDFTGNVVHTPETGFGGFQSPSGSPAQVTFTGLEYNKKYTVVARKKGALDVQAQDLREDGSVIATDPGGELELDHYIVKTNDGTVVKIERITADGLETAPGSGDVTYYSEAHKGDTVYLTAEAVNSAGMAFSHWEFTIGAVSGLNREVRTKELHFAMPAANLVLTAIYSRPAMDPEIAAVSDEVRGGSRQELALSPDEAPVLEGYLTTEADRVLINTNHTSVQYRAVYQKTGVKATESDAVKEFSPRFTQHSGAYKGAWGLNVSVERHVDGRKVNHASPSNASFKTYVQLSRTDVDMMDYELYDVTPDPDGGVTPVRVNLESDPEETGGLFAFRAEDGHRYVMAYSRAYRLNFKNNTGSIGGRQYDYSFKVRRNEAPADGYYAGSDSYGGADQDQPVQFTGPNGAIYNYAGWSRRKTAFALFDPDQEIIRNTDIFAWYDSDEEEVNDARKELLDYVNTLLGLGDDHFLKEAESREMKGYIEAAQVVLEKADATREELLAAMDQLKADSADLVKKLDYRYGDYGVKTVNRSKGGSTGGGGGGMGTKQKPYNDIPSKTYRIGTNGNWVTVTSPDGGSAQLSFVLNGGTPLRGMWAKLEPEHSNETGAASGVGAGEPGAAGLAGEGAAAWYRFNDKGLVETGWINVNGAWYYCNTEQEGSFGRMAAGWKKDGSDGNWYYLDQVSGAMATGWQQLDGKWYYFDAVGAGVYQYDSTGGNWIYGGGTGRPLGAMYKNEETPDGYRVGSDGAWIQ